VGGYDDAGSVWRRRARKDEATLREKLSKKVFSCVGHALMVNPKLSGEPPTNPYESDFVEDAFLTKLVSGALEATSFPLPHAMRIPNGATGAP
jgi:hypothetical protein